MLLKKKAKKKIENEESDVYDSEEEFDDYYDSEEDMEQFNLIFSTLGGGGQNKEEISDQNAVNEEHDEECNSEDEKNFMAENYENIQMPEEIVKKRDKEKLKKQKKQRNKSEKSDNSDIIDAEKEYKNLIELKKQLGQQLTKNPKNKILLKAVDECRDEIRKLVKKSRMKNAKKYYKMIKGEDK